MGSELNVENVLGAEGADAGHGAQDMERPVADADGACRSKRADARRNYERLVGAARRVFASEGAGASMEAIAREAGVGVGTLYRHFPKRIDVVEAVYRDDVDELVRTAHREVDELEPWPALVAFLEAFVRYAKSKRTLLSELREAFDKNPELKSQSRERLDQAMSLVLDRAQRAGAARADVSGRDVTQLVGPMCTYAALPDDQSDRLLAMILDGLRPPSEPRPNRAVTMAVHDGDAVRS